MNNIPKIKNLLLEARYLAVGYSSLWLDIKKIIDKMPEYMEEMGEISEKKVDKKEKVKLILAPAKRGGYYLSKITYTFDQGMLGREQTHYPLLEDAWQAYSNYGGEKKVDENLFKDLGLYDALKKVQRREELEFKTWKGGREK